jgi:DNA-binding winged helix-turn-helix (wHTH) protein
MRVEKPIPAPGPNEAAVAFELDAPNACVRLGSRQIAFTPKTFGVLEYLVAHRDRLVSKNELLDAVWPETAVTDAVLKVCVGQIRKALGDSAASPRFIETVHRRGYRFIASADAFAVPRVSPGAAFDLEGKSAERGGRVLVGRDPVLEELSQAFSRAAASQRCVVFVSGEPGVGKTALVDEFLRRLEGIGDLLHARGQCFEQYGGGEPYLPVLEAVARLCR